MISSGAKFTNRRFSPSAEEEATDPSGFKIERVIVRHGGSAVMLVVDDRDRVLLVKQFRLPAEKDLWEIPAGRLDPGEKPLQTAKRELIGRDRLQREEVEEAGLLLAQPRLRFREDAPLPGDGSHRRQGHSRWRTSASRSAGFRTTTRAHDPWQQNSRWKNNHRILSLEEPVGLAKKGAWPPIKMSEIDVLSRQQNGMPMIGHE